MKVIEMKAAGIELDMHLGALFGGGKDAEVKTLARLGRIVGKLVLLREEFVDIFELEELYQRIVADDLPVPLLFAMQDSETKRKVSSIISKPKITQSDVDKLVDFTMEALPVLTLKQKMRNLMEEGRNLAERTPNHRIKNKLQTLAYFMLEDL